jgi:hypothetical protein
MWFGVTLEKGRIENNFHLQETSSRKCRTYQNFLFMYGEGKKICKGKNI